MSCLSNLKSCGNLFTNYADTYAGYVIMRSTAKEVLKYNKDGTIGPGLATDSEYWPMYFRDAGLVGNLTAKSKKDFMLLGSHVRKKLRRSGSRIIRCPMAGKFKLRLTTQIMRLMKWNRTR